MQGTILVSPRRESNRDVRGDDSRKRLAKFQERRNDEPKGETMKTINIDGIEYVKKSDISKIEIPMEIRVTHFLSSGEIISSEL